VLAICQGHNAQAIEVAMARREALVDNPSNDNVSERYVAIPNLNAPTEKNAAALALICRSGAVVRSLVDVIGKRVGKQNDPRRATTRLHQCASAQFGVNAVQLTQGGDTRTDVSFWIAEEDIGIHRNRGDGGGK
jgi:hypothetical protein